MSQPFKYFLFNKPYGVLSQFTKEVPDHVTLADFMKLPADVYPVGRLDKDSEGLLLLTNDNILKTKLLDPKSGKVKTYIAQVEGDITEAALSQLRSGVTIKVNKKTHHCLPAKVKKLIDFECPDREPPVRYRAHIPTSWIEIKIQEGKNRQVRKMGAAVGYPVLRLIRTRFASYAVEDLSPGKYKAVEKPKM